ncbi:MAG: LysR family transcriptional regulator [Pseudomonadota bacterium]
MHFDFVSLKAFLAVAETKSFRAASERLNLSISSVSRRISDLEFDFGQTLFKRHSRGVEITEAGSLLVERAQDAFSSLNILKSDMERFRHGEVGRLSVSANGSALINGLAGDVALFLKEHPTIEIDLQEKLTPIVLDHVEKGDVDVGFVSKTMRMPKGVKAQPYVEDNLVLAVPQNHPLADQDSALLEHVIDDQIIGVGEHSSLTRLIRKMAVAPRPQIDFRYMAETNEVARTLVSQGLGVTILPEKFVSPYLDLLSIRSIPLDEEWAKREIALIVSTETELSGPSQTFCDWIHAKAESERLLEEPA